jgi:hypothetical protein
MTKTEKRFMVTCLVAIFIFLGITLVCTHCALIEKGPIVNATKLIECSQIAQHCIENLQYAKANGNPEQLAGVTIQCANEWVTEGCQQLVNDVAEQIKQLEGIK